SAYPGVSIRLILTPLYISGATARPTERCWRTAAGSWSQTVVPSVTEPALVITPAAVSRASVRVVLPEPDGPTRTMLRTLAGSSTATAAPPSPLSVFLAAMMINLPRKTALSGEPHRGNDVLDPTPYAQ